MIVKTFLKLYIAQAAAGAAIGFAIPWLQWFGVF